MRAPEICYPGTTLPVELDLRMDKEVQAWEVRVENEANHHPGERLEMPKIQPESLFQITLQTRNHPASFPEGLRGQAP